MKLNRKIFAYSNNTNYVVCLCEIDDSALNKFRNDIKVANQFDLLHKFDSMFGDGIINLGVFTDDLVGDVENISKVTTEFLDILEVKEKKVSSLEEFSQEFRCAQMGVFGTDIENNSRLREYVSSVSNNNVMEIIGYDLNSKINRKSKESKVKRKISTVAV